LACIHFPDPGGVELCFELQLYFASVELLSCRYRGGGAARLPAG